MALNKYMHPRNIYKNPPDFEKLAKTFTEFSNIAKVDITGKLKIDFKDPHSLRVLTKCLLKSDFNLDVDIPEDRLVPTLPLRLNYILWIEDLLYSIDKNSDVQGLDIGTGACAIYPLLAAVKNKWHMVATETDDKSLQKAQENVDKNNLQALVKLKKNCTQSVIEQLLIDDSEQNFHFCVCNPPFYCSTQELCESRSPARPPPKNGFTGSPQELITEGGELAFCRKLIEESKKFKHKIILFTTMVGHKYNLKELSQDLKADGVNHTTTEFCQGRVTRWGLAWTFMDYDLYKLVPPRDKPRKKNPPVLYILPELPNTPYEVENFTKKLKSILENLNIKYKILNKRGHTVSLDVVATVNTWSNQRRKRRLMKKEETNVNVKKQKQDNLEQHSAMDANHDKTTSPLNTIDNTQNNSKLDKILVDVKKEDNLEQHSVLDTNHDKTTSPLNTIDNTQNNSELDKILVDVKKQDNLEQHSLMDTNRDYTTSPVDTTDNKNAQSKNELHKIPVDVKKQKDNLEQNSVTDTNHYKTTSPVNTTDNNITQSNNELSKITMIGQSSTSNDNTEETVSQSAATVLVHAIFKVLKQDVNILLEIEYLDGTAGKEGLHQIVQYIKNNWK